MRAVNLIPPEDRRGDRAPARRGPLAYVVVGGLAAALAAVTLMVLASNQIADQQSEITTLQSQESQAKAEADRLKPFAEFASVQQAREDTVSSLARSRFDWERVLRELAIVMPSDVWLIKLSATVNPNVELQNGADIAQRSEVPGPALEIVGCGASQDSVAGLVAALKDIDGVTRVTVSKSEKPEQDSGTGAASAEAAPSGTGAVEDCRTRDFIARFEIVAAFDGVQLDPTTEAPVPPPAAQPTGGSNDGGVGDAQQQEAAARQSAAQQTQKANRAVDTLIPGVVR